MHMHMGIELVTMCPDNISRGCHSDTQIKGISTSNIADGRTWPITVALPATPVKT